MLKLQNRHAMNTVHPSPLQPSTLNPEPPAFSLFPQSVVPWSVVSWSCFLLSAFGRRLQKSCVTAKERKERKERKETGHSPHLCGLCAPLRLILQLALSFQLFLSAYFAYFAVLSLAPQSTAAADASAPAVSSPVVSSPTSDLRPPSSDLRPPSSGSNPQPSTPISHLPSPISQHAPPSTLNSQLSAVSAGRNMDALDDKQKLAVGDRVSFRVVEDQERSQGPDYHGRRRTGRA